MQSFDSKPLDTASGDATTPSCPACKSLSTTTTAAKPDAESYWRCTACGEVWNQQRRRAPHARF